MPHPYPCPGAHNMRHLVVVRSKPRIRIKSCTTPSHFMLGVGRTERGTGGGGASEEGRGSMCYGFRLIVVDLCGSRMWNLQCRFTPFLMRFVHAVIALFGKLVPNSRASQPCLCIYLDSISGICVRNVVFYFTQTVLSW